MKLTDNNIDKNSARYWCFLSDNKLKEALKEVIKDTNRKTKKTLNEVEPITGSAIAATLASAAGGVVLWDILGRAYANLTDTTELPKYQEMIDNMKNHAYLDTDTVKTELEKLRKKDKKDKKNKKDDDAFYKLVAASYIVRNYGEETEKNVLSKPVLGYERYSTEKQVTNSDLHQKNTFYKTSPIEDLKSNLGLFSSRGHDPKYDTETVKAAYEFLSKHNPIQIAAAVAVDKTIDNSTMLLRTTKEFNLYPNGSKDFRDNVNPLTVSDGMFISGMIDYDKRKIDYIEKALMDGTLQAQVKDGEISIADNMEKLNNASAANMSSQAGAQEEKSKEKSEEGKQEKDKQEQQAEQAAEKAVEDSPSIKSNSNAVAWIAGAAVAAVALPYLWKRLKQLADYVKSGHTLAMCKFRCSENYQEYQFEYNLKQMEWKLKFAGSTALKYTPYPSDDEVKSFVQTKFAKKFVDEVESQLKSLYSAKDKKILFKAVQAAGKEGSDLIKYLFDNQKAIESSLYGIKKHKIWESVCKYRKYRKWA